MTMGWKKIMVIVYTDLLGLEEAHLQEIMEREVTGEFSQLCITSHPSYNCSAMTLALKPSTTPHW